MSDQEIIEIAWNGVFILVCLIVFLGLMGVFDK